MKLSKYIVLAALPIVFAACQDDVLVENHESEQGITTLFGIMEDSLSDSRAQIALGNQNTRAEKFMWNVGDEFTLFQTWQKGAETLLYSVHPFTISDDYTYEKNGPKGPFSTNEPLVDGRSYVAFYPSESLDMEGNNPEGYLSFRIQETLKDNSHSSWINYFKKNMFLKSVGTIQEGFRDINFQHLCGIIRVTYTNGTKSDQELKGLYVNGSFGLFRQFNIFEPDVITGQGNSAGYYGVTFEDKAVVKSGQSQDFYILFFPPTVYGDVTINPMTKILVDYDVAEENNHMSSTPEYYQGRIFSYKAFNAGKCYWFKITGLENERLAWTKDMNGDEGGEEEEPEVDRYEKEIFTFEDLEEALAVNAREIELEFKADIALKSPLTINHPTNFYMNGKKITLDPAYESHGEDAVFDVSTRLYVKHGDLFGTDGEKTLHDYYFKLSGENADLSFRGVELNTGTAITNAVYLDDDYLNLNAQPISETASKECKIVTPKQGGNAIHWNALQSGPQHWSRINGTINGNVLIETEFNKLNTYMIFQSGTIDGELNCTGPADLVVSEYIVRSWENVAIGSAYAASWNKAGRFVEDLNEHVTDEKGLRDVISRTQIAKETTHIYLSNNITLTSPLTIVKPVILHLQEKTLSLSNSFDWGTSDAAILVTRDAVMGKSGSLHIEGRYNGGPVENVNGKIQGATAESGKYLIKNTVDALWVKGATIVGNNKLNGIFIEDSRLVIDGDYQTNITVDEDCFALNMIAQSQRTQVNLQCGVNIVGDVGLTNNYVGDKCTFSKYLNGIVTIKGDLIKTGSNKDGLILNLENTTIEGEGWYPEVSTLSQIEEYARQGNRKMVLTAPLTITDAASEKEFVGINLYGATLLLSDSFDWSNVNAAITLSGTKEKMIDNGTIQGSTTAAGKYLIYSTSHFNTGGLTLIAKNQMNAVYVEDRRCNLSGSSVEAKDGYALYVKASAVSCASVCVNKGSTVKGKVYFENNYPINPGVEDKEPSHFDVMGGMVSGNLTLGGSNQEGLEFHVGDGGSIVGKGWPEMSGVSLPTGNVNNSGTSSNNFGDGGEF